MKSFLLLLAILPGLGFANSVLTYENVRILEVENFEEGGNSLVRILYEHVEGVGPGRPSTAIGCNPNDNAISGRSGVYQVAYMNSGITPDNRNQQLASTALAALAMDKYVDIYLNTSGCDTNSRYRHGGAGREWRGLTIKR